MSWLSVVVAALAYYLLGALWFSPLFGKAWDRSIGHTREKRTRFQASYYVVPFVSAVLVTIAVALILRLVQPQSLVDALGLGTVVATGIALPISINNSLTPHTPHPFLHGIVTGGYHLAGIIGVSCILQSLNP
ncbi:DUF1761 domain-containing protein [Saxibacter everestensis]|uniref:DUF1761 domain-containing protein n=1 Tax=Saxibacter everestensis TaxID=2909229 RepID=A0ABY8QY52_9MICO|nr:DUF1761 domain-containing protein [Brevibacteriaceae bacterium ZFBP1038]